MNNKNIIAVTNLLRCLDKTDLRNPEVVANLVRAFGIMNWGPRTAGPESVFIVPQGGGAAIGQTPGQIAELLTYLSVFNISTFCEIGIMHGGNFLFTSEYLRRFNPDIQCLGVDPTNYLNGEVKDIIDSNPYMRLLKETSDAIAGQKFDFVFIDADHVAPWPQKDYENVGQYAKFCAIHDLQDPMWPDVKVLWDTLQDEPGKSTITFLDDPSGCSTHGIGLLYDSEAL
jgi:hypothetical protein